MIPLICTVIAFACAVALAILCYRLRKENERLLKWLEEPDLRRGKIVDTLLTDRRRLEREIEQAQKDLYREREYFMQDRDNYIKEIEELEQKRDYYVDQINCIQCPDRFEITDYGTHYEVSGFCDDSPEPGAIHSYSYDPEDEFSKAYAKNLAEELVDKLQEQAI